MWQAPDGTVVRAHLPEDVNGQHFGPILKAFATNLYAHGVTQPALYEFLTGLGFEISAGKTNDILLDEAEQYATVSEEILTAGLEKAPFIRADDTDLGPCSICAGHGGTTKRWGGITANIT